MEPALCALHTANAIRWKCTQCGKALCTQCGAIAFGGAVYCQSCGHIVGRGPSTPEPVSSGTPLGIKCLGWFFIGFACIGFVFVLFGGIGSFFERTPIEFSLNGQVISTWHGVIPIVAWVGLALVILFAEFYIGMELLSLAPWTRWVLLGLAGMDILVNVAVLGMGLLTVPKEPAVFWAAALQLAQWCAWPTLVLWYFNRRPIRAAFRKT